MAAPAKKSSPTITLKHLAANLAESHELSKKQTEAVLGVNPTTGGSLTVSTATPPTTGTAAIMSAFKLSVFAVSNAWACTADALIASASATLAPERSE